MNLSAAVLGQHLVGKLEARANAPLLTIGRDVFYRRDLAGVGCFNFIAAAHLSAACDRLGVANTRALFDDVPPTALVMPQVGAVSLAVLGAAFEAKGIGGNQPLEAWVLKHTKTNGHPGHLVTFDTLKHREAQREVGERKAAKARKRRTHARRNQAQHLRAGRFMMRRAKATSHAEASS